MKKSYKLMTACVLTGVVGFGAPVGNLSHQVLTSPIVSAQAKTVEDFHVGDSKIKGTINPGETVKITFAPGKEVTATAATDGKWEITIPSGITINEGDKISVTIINANNEETVETVVTLPEQTSIEESSTKDTTIAPIETTVQDTSVAETTTPETTEAIPVETTVEMTTAPVETTIQDTTVAETTSAPVKEETTQAPIKEETTIAKEETTAAKVETTEAQTSKEQTVVKDIKHYVAINQVTSGSKTVSGKSSPNAVVTLRFNKTGDKVVVNADAQGNWTAEVPTNVGLVAGDVIAVTSLNDKDEQAYQEMTVAKINQTQPKSTHFVTINNIAVNDKKISGTTTPNSTVTLMFVKTQDKETVTADANGNWVVHLPFGITLQAGDLINVTSGSPKSEVAFAQKKVIGGFAAILPQTGESTSVWVYTLGALSLIAAAILGLRHKNKSAIK